jgi:hypothetical protein
MADAGDGSARFEGLIRPWFFPFFGLTAAVAVGVFYVTGLLSESAVGGMLAVIVPLVLGLMVARPAMGRGAPTAARALLVAAGILSFVVAMVPALEAVHPGEPVFVGELETSAPAAALPEGVGGRVMVLVSTRLAAGAEPSVGFRLEGFDPPVEGRLERTYTTARVGRGGSARIARDHDSDWFEARIPAGAREIRLERAQGLVGAPLRVAIYRVWLPHAVVWILALLVMALAAAGEVRAGADHGSAIAAGVALGFGLVVGYNVTPARAVVPSLWAIVLGAIAGAPVAVGFRMLARRLLGGERAGAKGGKGKAKG